MEAVGSYEGLVDFIPNTHTNALCEPAGERLPLTHHQLREFLLNEFDLTKFGIPRGARVGVLLPNSPELALCVVSVVSNWCAAPINPTNTWEEIKSELTSFRACAIIILAGASNDAALRAAEELSLGVLVLNPSGSITGMFRLVSLVPVSSSTPIPGFSVAKTVTGFTSFGHGETVLLLHTSGTSGTKKLVPYSMDMLICGIGSIICSWNLQPSDVCLNMMPLFHIGGIVRNIFSPILSGGSVISCSGFDPILFWNVLSNQRVTWYYAAPTMHHAILMEADKREKPLPVDSVRFIANAAGGLLPVLATSLRKFLLVFFVS
jgi:acyl-CoA synthetase (AMP-forming)/AMP-acid ligase II